MGYRVLHPSWQRAVDSLDDVVRALGGCIRDKDTGKLLDPGQAVCREMFGPDWMRSAAFHAFDTAEVCGPEFFEAVTRLAARQPAWLDLEYAEKQLAKRTGEAA